MLSLNRISSFIGKYYRIDIRSLSLMRIAISLIILADLFIRLGDLSAHYTDDGVWPGHLIKNFGWNNGYWSIHLLNGTYGFELLLFVLHLCLAFALLIGFKTRLTTFLVWLLYISLHNRNIYILQGGDDLLRIILFWGLFLPWGSRYSVDSLKTKIINPENNYANIAYFLLIASVYFFSALHKYSEDWLKNFDAVYYALSLEQLRLPFGDILIQYPALLKPLTILVYAIELVAPVLIIWPQKTGRLRLIAFLFLLMLHIGIGLNLFVGLFFLIGISSALALLPSSTMDKLEKLFKIRQTALEESVQEIKYKWLHVSKFIFVTIIVILCLILNCGTLPYNEYRLRSELYYPINVLRLNQNWSMFAPGVLRRDGWFVYHGMDSLGRQWDLRLNQDYVDETKPEHIVNMYKNDRWRKFAENMQNDNYTFLRPLFCKYQLKRWNILHPEKKILTLNLYFMEKMNQAGFKSSKPEKKLYCSCYVH